MVEKKATTKTAAKKPAAKKAPVQRRLLSKEGRSLLERRERRF